MYLYRIGRNERKSWEYKERSFCQQKHARKSMNSFIKHHFIFHKLINVSVIDSKYKE